ncbi:hypothetical protein [Bordetella bronchialis]|uniref:hypothetical protein n=1 Tax=Bordetella bronchialis TaxID=463025 RepID=UPI0012EA83F0|nr:hypothetical protein [Bordetella bronchialis]
MDIAIDSPVVIVELPQDGLVRPYDGRDWQARRPARDQQGIEVEEAEQARGGKNESACFEPSSQRNRRAEGRRPHARAARPQEFLRFQRNAQRERPL